MSEDAAAPVALMRFFRLTVAYDGTGMVGWQRQAAGTSVQGLLEAAAGELVGHPVAVAGAGRTDAGVHALGQVASLSLDRDIDAGTLARALNFKLPAQVRVVNAVEVDDAFHARFDARGKAYRYHLWNGPVVPPMHRAFVWHVPLPELDVAAMHRAARALEGRHDFAAFQSLGSDLSTTERIVFSSAVRTVGAAEDTGIAAGLSMAAGRLIAYDVSGSGFLRHMVRSIVGTLVDIGRGRRDAAWIPEILSSKDRARAGQTAPPEGLFLVQVTY
jgi:tRNA pseudouridine38-40 synthase